MRWTACLGYAAPALPLAALYFPVFVYIAPFYAEFRDVSLGALGGLFIVVRLFDAVSDPAMGWLSDRTASRFGRRRPYLALSVPLICISVWMLMVPPEGADVWHVALWLTLLTLSWTVALTPYFAWGAELSGNYARRATITTWREGASLIGTVLAVILYNIADGAAEGLGNVALMVVILLPITAAIALFLTPEPYNFSARQLDLRQSLITILQDRLFRRLLLAYFVNGLANALPAGLFLFFIGDLLGAPDAGWLLLVYFLCAIGGMPFWSWAAQKFSKHRAWGSAMIYASVLFAPAVLLGEGDVLWFTVISIATGVALGADLSLPPAIQADVVDNDTATNGEQRTGVFFALWSVATKAALAIAGGTALIILDLSGFETGGQNDDAALFTLAALYALAPAILKIIAVAIMWNFPLGEAQQKALRSRIEAA